MSGHLFCVGHGYCAQHLAVRLLRDGWAVRGTTRSADKAASMRRMGVTPVRWDGAGPLPAAALAGSTHALLSIAPDETVGDPALQHAAEALAATPTLRWLGYLSTTGVYGDHDGAWVDETTPTQPTIARSQRRVTAEAGWLAWGAAHEVAVQIFRLAGIYGPLRNPLSKLKAGTARRIDAPEVVFSRCHVADIATVLQASMAQPRAGGIYNVCDDLPASAAVVTAFAAALLGMEPPPLQTPDEANLSPLARSFYSRSRRVRNQRIKAELGVSLAYPDYRTGLRQLALDRAY